MEAARITSLESAEISDSENYLLSVLMQNRKTAETILTELTEADFTTDARANAFRILKERYAKNAPMDAPLVRAALEAAPTYPQLIADYDTFVNLYSLAFSDLFVAGHVELLKKHTKSRRLSQYARRILASVEGGKDPDEVREAAEKDLYTLESKSENRHLIDPVELASGIFSAVSNRLDDDLRSRDVIYTPFKQLNRNSGGFDKGDLVILSAGSGVGKSAFAMNLAANAGMVERRPTLYINSEMSDEQIFLRYASFFTKMSHRNIRAGGVDSADKEKIRDAVLSVVEHRIKGNKLYTLTMPDMQIPSVISEMRRAKAQFGTEFVVVDYIGRMNLPTARDVKEWQTMLEAARRLKTTAQEQKIVVIMVAQLTSDGGRLAQGSYMMHEADLWINLRRFDEAEEKKNYPWNCALEFRKARNAEVGSFCKLRFHGDNLTFTEDLETAQHFYRLEQNAKGVLK